MYTLCHNCNEPIEDSDYEVNYCEDCLYKAYLDKQGHSQVEISQILSEINL